MVIAIAINDNDEVIRHVIQSFTATHIHKSGKKKLLTCRKSRNNYLYSAPLFVFFFFKYYNGRKKTIYWCVSLEDRQYIISSDSTSYKNLLRKARKVCKNYCIVDFSYARTRSDQTNIVIQDDENMALAIATKGTLVFDIQQRITVKANIPAKGDIRDNSTLLALRSSLEVMSCLLAFVILSIVFIGMLCFIWNVWISQFFVHKDHWGISSSYLVAGMGFLYYVCRKKNVSESEKY